MTEIIAWINRVLITTLSLLLLFSSPAYASGSGYEIYYYFGLIYTAVSAVYIVWVIISALLRKHIFVISDFIKLFIFFPAGNMLILLSRHIMVFGSQPTRPNPVAMTIVFVLMSVTLIFFSILPIHLAVKFFLTLRNEKTKDKPARLAYSGIPVISGGLSLLLFSPLVDFIDNTFEAFYAMDLFFFGGIIFFSIVFLAGLFPLVMKIREAGSIKAFISGKEAPG